MTIEQFTEVVNKLFDHVNVLITAIGTMQEVQRRHVESLNEHREKIRHLEDTLEAQQLMIISLRRELGEEIAATQEVIGTQDSFNFAKRDHSHGVGELL